MYLYHVERISMQNDLITIGWREWVTLPDLGLQYIKAKIDSGRETSILHTFLIEKFEAGGTEMVRFGVHPHQNSPDIAIMTEAPILKQLAGASLGEPEERFYVIRTQIIMGNETWPIDLLLANRDDMNFRLLLGLSAIDQKAVIDPSKSYQLGDITEEEFIVAYRESKIAHENRNSVQE